jgi:hypothetical protein
MTIGIIENPLRKEVHNSPYYAKLLNLDKEWFEKVEGNDVEWLIDSRQRPSPTPSPLPDSQVALSLQNEVEWLWETIDLLNKGWYQNKLWLDSIEDEKEADEAIINLLKAVRLYWRTYLESDDKEIFKKMPVLGSRFSKHDNRVKAFDLITSMGEVLEKEKIIDTLLIEWHGGKTWDDYNKKYDFDNSLWAFTQLLYLKKKYQAEKQELKPDQTSQGTQTEKPKPSLIS